MQRGRSGTPPPAQRRHRKREHTLERSNAHAPLLSLSHLGPPARVVPAVRGGGVARQCAPRAAARVSRLAAPGSAGGCAHPNSSTGDENWRSSPAAKRGGVRTMAFCGGGSFCNEAGRGAQAAVSAPWAPLRRGRGKEERPRPSERSTRHALRRVTVRWGGAVMGERRERRRSNEKRHCLHSLFGTSPRASHHARPVPAWHNPVAHTHNLPMAAPPPFPAYEAPPPPSAPTPAAADSPWPWPAATPTPGLDDDSPHGDARGRKRRRPDAAASLAASLALGPSFDPGLPALSSHDGWPVLTVAPAGGGDAGGVGGGGGGRPKAALGGGAHPAAHSAPRWVDAAVAGAPPPPYSYPRHPHPPASTYRNGGISGRLAGGVPVCCGAVGRCPV